MKNFYFLTLILFPFIINAQTNEGQNSTTVEPFISIFNNLVWSDEFDVDGPIDSEKWFHQSIIPNGNSWFNGEIQHYTDRTENAVVENGVLKIIAQKETFSDQGVTKEYTSARLNSKFAFTQGRVEIRAKLPTGVGTWPAIWMLGKNITEKGAYWETQGFGTTGWPACGEIDIMEHWGNNQDYVSSAIHTPSSFGGTINIGGTTLPGASNEFHVYTMEWTEDEIIFSIDEFVHYTYSPSVKDDSTWPFYQDQYILFNVAILPSISSNFTESALEIDYIRIFQGEETTSLDALSREAHLIYPNPIKDTFIIDLQEVNLQTIELQIFDSNGKLISTSLQTVQDHKLEIHELNQASNGFYFIQFQVEEEMYRYKVVKQ
jgi:beta-glucanase (GH16 family)